MTVQQARVPVLDETGRFPDAYAPPSVAANTAAAQEARTGAETAANNAGTARDQAETFAGQAQTSAGNAAGSASDAQDAVNAVPAAVTSALSTWFLRGNGSPLGVITPASAGMQYVDLAATNGARVWISTGTTGYSWRVAQGDTGWRNITALLAPALDTHSTVMVRRSNDVVMCALASINATPTTKAFFSLPVGFNPEVVAVSAALFPSNQSAPVPPGGVLTIAWNGVNSFVIGTGAWCDGCVTWATPNGWPLTLPGTPV